MNTETVYPILAGKRALVVGVANEHSIAWGCALAFRKLGADVVLTYLNEKAYPHVAPLAAEIDAQLLPLDVTQPGQLEALFSALAGQGPLDIVVHSIAFAPKADLQGACSIVRSTVSCRRWTCRATRSCAWQNWPRR